MYAWEYSFDILPAASGEDSYGLLLFLQDDFGGFLPQPPYFSGGSRGGFTFGLPAHRSCDRKDDKHKTAPSIPVLKIGALRRIGVSSDYRASGLKKAGLL